MPAIPPNPDARPVIAHVLHRLDVAGAEVLAAGLARAIRPRFESVFFCLDGVGTLGEELRGRGFVVENLHRKPGLDFAVAMRLRKLIRRHRIDLLHAHQYTPFFYAAASRAHRHWPPILFTEHGRHYPDSRSTKRVIANRLLLSANDRVTAVGAFVKRALVANEGISESRIEVVYNGIDPARFAKPARFDRAAVRRTLNLPDTAPVLLQVARFHSVKDHATALRAFARVREAMPAAHFLLAGDGPLRESLQILVAELNLGSHVHFLGVRDDVAALMHAADVFVLSSLSEGVSVTLLEAMAAGLPICATDVGGNGEVVEHTQTGLLSDRGDDAELAANIQAMLGDATRRNHFAKRGIERVRQRFDQQLMHEAYAALYSQMLPGADVDLQGAA